jgi:RNA polymerase sigma-70 factor, ECF subfamily
MRLDTCDQAYAAGRDAWPACDLDRGRFMERAVALEESAVGDGGPELYLAIAIEAGVAGAAEELERCYLRQLPVALASYQASATEIDEVVQLVRTKLIAPRDDGTTPLVDYAGRGQLDGLMRVTAVRAFLSMRQKAAREIVGVEEGWLDAIVAPDLARETLADAERADVKEAIAAALRELGGRERALLRMHFVNELGIDPIAKMLGVHRATAARQISRLKQELVDRVRKLLAQRWGGDSAVAVRVASSVDLSLERLLASVQR